jgi:hypothetical protein
MADKLRILTVRQPWAWAIIHGGKTIENRVRNIAGSYRGPVAIHAAQHATDYVGWLAFGASDPAGHNPVGRIGTTDIRGAIIGVVDLVDVHRAARHYEPIEGTPWVMECTDKPCCAPWGQREMEHLKLANPRPLSEPIPYKGALGLRRLDDETTARVWKAVA